MRGLAVTLLLAIAATAAAIPPPPPADLSVAAAFRQSSIGDANTGTLRVTVTNHGWATAYDIGVRATFVRAHPLPASGATWRCTTTLGEANCVIRQQLLPSHSVTIEIPLVADASPAGDPAAVGVTVDHRSAASDPDKSNNSVGATVPIRPTQLAIDAAIRVEADPAAPVSLAPLIRRVFVTNRGARRLTNVTVYVTTVPNLNLASIEGDWSCASNTCTYAKPIASGETVELPLELQPILPGRYDGSVSVVAAGGAELHDADNHASFRVELGIAADYEAVLVPMLADGVPGAFGTIWRNELFAHTDTATPILGGPCGNRIEPRPTQQIWPAPGCTDSAAGMLLWVPRTLRQTVTFTSTLYEGTDLVAQLPVVRGGDFRQVVTFPRVPRMPNHRYSIRVYSLDPDARWAELSPWPAWVTHFPGVVPYATAELTRASDERVELGLLRHPAYAEFGHDTVMRMLEASAEPQALVVYGPAPVWAMLVLVDNANQRPVFLTPQ